MTTDLFLDFLAILMDSRKAEGMEFTINLITPDNGEKFVIELSGATLTNIEGYQAENADLTLTIPRLGLAQVITGAKSLQDQIADGSAQAVGDVTVLKRLASTMVRFDPGFEILPGTKGPATKQDLNDFEVGPIGVPAE
jgi:alkyl sulfatase BDS1-like metallo-beta-lactamase superfamily hydrolase